MQKNQIDDSKVESTDSPEILDKGEPSDSPGLPPGKRFIRKYHIPRGHRNDIASTPKG